MFVGGRVEAYGGVEGEGGTYRMGISTDCESSIAPKLGMALRSYWDRRTGEGAAVS